MSQTGKSFEDFLRWKKEQQMRGGRRYKDESSSDTDSSVEEVRYSKRSVSNKKKYHDESDSSSSSSSDDDRRRRRRSTQVSSKEVRRDRSSKSSRGDKGRSRNRDDSSSDGDVVIINNRRVKSRGSRRESSRSNSKRNHRQYDESSSDDDRYNRNVDSDDSDDSGRRRRPTVSKRSTSTRRSKSERNSKTNSSRGRREDSSSEEAPRRTQTKKKTINRRPPAQHSESSSDEVVSPPKSKITKKSAPTKSTKSPTQSKPEHKLSIHKKESRKGDSSSSSSSSSSDDEKVTKKKPTIKAKHSVSEIDFDHALWLDNWDKTYTNKDKEPKKKRSLLKELLQQIEDMTDHVCQGTKYYAQDKNSNEPNIYNLDAASIAPNVKKTTLYAYHHLEKYIPTEKGATKTTAHFVKSDILDVGLFVKKEIKRNPLVLVMGDARTPGGKDHRCLFGEEISIWRRTALREFLESDRRRRYFKEGEKDTFVYDIPQNGAVYCPNVPVFRSNSKKGYSFTSPETLSFVVVPPLMNPELEDDRLKEEDVEIIRKKLTMIFLVALANKHDAVVVTAFGCGYAQNPPKHVAEIFNEVIAKFRNHFSNILFAIIDNANARKNSPEGNIIPFNNAFGHLQKKPSQNASNSNLTKEQKEKLDN